MAMTCRVDDAAKLLEVVIEGAVTEDDARRVGAAARALADRHGNINVLERITGLDTIGMQALVSGARLDMQLLGRVSRVAIIGDQSWIEGGLKVVGPITSVKLNHFPPGQTAAARQWASTAGHA